MKATVIAMLAAFVFPLPAVAAGGKTAKPIRIGMSSPYAAQPFQAALLVEAQAAADELGARIVGYCATASAEKQANDVDALVKQGVRGIIISPMRGITPAIDGAVKAGVSVATVDNVSEANDVLVHVGLDNVEAGRVAARFIIERLGNKGTVIELEGPMGVGTSFERKAGFDEEIGKSNVKLLVSTTVGWHMDQAHQVIVDLLRRFPEADALFAANDQIVSSAIRAMMEAQIDPSSKVTIGIDGTPQAVEYIKDGKLTATVDGSPGKQARWAVKYMVDYIEHKKMPPRKVVLLEPELVTKATLAR